MTVVGGGVVGLFTAYHLSLRGYSVVVVDDASGNATRASGGLITPSFASASGVSVTTVVKGLLGLGAFKVSPIWALRNLGWVREAVTRRAPLEAVRVLAEASLGEYLDLLTRDLQGVYWRRGIIGLFRSPSEASGFAALVGGRVMDEKELREAGIEGLAGVFLEREAFVDPDGLLEALSRRLSDLGVPLYNSRSLKVLVEGERVGVSLDSGDRLVSDWVVVAAGSRSGEILKRLGYSLPLAPARGLAIIARAGKTHTMYPALLEDYGVVVAPLPEKRCRITGFFELVGYKASWSGRRKAWLMRVVERHLPGLLGGRTHIEREVTGYRPCTPDQAPIVGRLPWAGRVIVNTGHCRLGVTLAPATARLVADIIDGREKKEWSPVLGPLSPSRFKPGPRLWQEASEPGEQ